LQVSGSGLFTNGLTVGTSSGNILVGTTATGAAGIGLLPSYNYSFAEGSGASYANIFRQSSSAATVIGNGYKYTATAGGFASSTGVPWGKSAIAVGAAGGGIAFYTDGVTTVANGTDVTPTERIRITPTGNVGIGTTSPVNKLDIIATNRTALNTAGSGINVNYSGSNVGEYATIGFSWAASISDYNTRWGMGMVGTNYLSGTAALNFFTNNVEHMRITSAGDVGIGTSSPSVKLDVSGNITASGTATAATIVKSGGTSSQSLMANGSVQTLISGTYTSTLTNVSNTSGLVFNSATYQRIGNIVTVFFNVSGTCTAAATNQFKMSIPVGNAFTNLTQCSGSAVYNLSSGTMGASIYAATTADAQFSFYAPTGVTSFGFYGSFQYQVQ
jgi:hypothetical protein